MEVVSVCPIRAGSLVWHPSGGGRSLTVICKATFELLPESAVLAEHQEYPNDDDNHWDDDPARSLYSPSDLVPFKPRADVLLVGHAFTPNREPASSLVVRLVTSGVDKSIQVFGERFVTPDGSVREGLAFSRMPLRYDRAAGGPDTDNPVGIPLEGAETLPNLEPIGDAITDDDETVAPGFGPIAPGWPTRVAKLGPHADRVRRGSLYGEPLPEGFDTSFFNAAPRDQQVDRIADGASIVLENMSAQHPRLATTLPGLHPRAFVVRRRRIAEEVKLTCDTLWIDTDRSLCTLVWRGQVALPALPSVGADQGKVLVLLEDTKKPLAWADIERVCSVDDADGGAETETFHLPADMARRGGLRDLPFVMARGAQGADGKPRAPGAASALPFGRPATRIPPVPVPTAAPSDVTLAPGLSKSPSPMASPEGGFPKPLPGLGSASGLAPAPAPMSSSIVLPQPPASATGVPLAPSSSPLVAPKPQPVPPPLVGHSVVMPAPELPPPSPPSPVAASSVGSALAASNSAIIAAPRVPGPTTTAPVATPSRTPATAPTPTMVDVVDLLWFDPASCERIRKNPPWEGLLAALAPKRTRKRFDDEPPLPEEPQDTKDERDIFGVMTEAEPATESGVEDILGKAVSPLGVFRPPLAVVWGELQLPFDELETLKATAATIGPVASGDKKTKEVIDLVTELLATPWLEGSRAVAESLTTRLREAWAPSSKAFPPGYVDAQVERRLLEQRHYQRRTLLKKPWIRALLSPPQAQTPIPTYVPTDLAETLPLYRRFRARVIAEVHLQQDQHETHVYAMKTLALARVTQVKAPR